MRKIDVGRGTENGAAKFAAFFGLLAKNHRGALCPPPIRARVNLVSLDGPTFARGHQRLRRVLRSISDAIRVVLLVSFHYDVCQKKLGQQTVKDLTFDTTCNAISDLQITFCDIFGKFMPGAITCRFGSKIGSVIWQIAEGVTRKTPRRRRPEIPHRYSVNTAICQCHTACCCVAAQGHHLPPKQSTGPAVTSRK